MKFQTEGNPKGPKVLLIHAMFTTYESFSKVVEYLKEDYFIIMPTLDGHDINNESTFLSSDDEADKIINYLNENHIDKLDFILGTSLGAIIAFEVYKRNAVQIDRAYFDGGPFFKFGPLLQKIAEMKFWGKCSKIRQNPQYSVEKINKIFSGLGSPKCSVCSHMTKENIKNLSHACYSFSLPDLSGIAQKSITFLYGTKEPARFCIPRLKRYKYSHIVMKDGYHHCGFLLANPKEYAQMLKNGSL